MTQITGMGQALHLGLSGLQTHTRLKKLGVSRMPRSGGNSRTSSQPSFFVGSLILVHVGHRLMLKTLYDYKLPTHVREHCGWGGRHVQHFQTQDTPHYLR